MTRLVTAAALVAAMGTGYPVHAQVTKYVRYETQGRTSDGILDSQTFRELSGDLFASPNPPGWTSTLAFVTLERGGVLYTGRPGSTMAMKPGHLVDVEIEGGGVLRNTTVAGSSSSTR